MENGPLGSRILWTCALLAIVYSLNGLNNLMWIISKLALIIPLKIEYDSKD
jgi:hypothetical protein